MKTYTKKQQIKDLEKARQLLVDKGWCQGSFKKGDKYCAWGAIGMATHGSCYGYGAKGNILKYLLEENISVELHRWNDDKKRTKRQVLGLFTRTINKLKKSGK